MKHSLYKLRMTRVVAAGRVCELYFYFRGEQHRPVLGYNITEDEGHRRAQKYVQEVMGRDAGAATVDGYSLQDAARLYWDEFAIRDRICKNRPQQIIDKHLMPFFGNKPLKDLTRADGVAYVRQRLDPPTVIPYRTPEPAAAGTVHREMNLMNRILRLAVIHDKLDKNRLECIAMPEANKRERAASDEELTLLAQYLSEPMMRLMVLALNTGLRQERLLSINRDMIRHRADGAWLILPPPKSPLKRHPRELPLNSLAMAALPHVIGGPIYAGDPRAFASMWSRAVRKAKVTDLHFHDLRHTFCTRLQNKIVGYEQRQILMGHRMPGMTDEYSHGGEGINASLRSAVTKLETCYDFLWNLLSWCPQRDLNPCCSLESTVDNQTIQRTGEA